MPLYDYKCDDCGGAAVEFQHMRDAALAVCSVCGGKNYHRVPSVPHTDMKDFTTPIEMMSIAMNDIDEIKAFKAKCPDVDVSGVVDDPMFGVPIARNRRQKLDALKAAGFQEAS